MSDECHDSTTIDPIALAIVKIASRDISLRSTNFHCEDGVSTDEVTIICTYARSVNFHQYMYTMCTHHVKVRAQSLGVI